jgi:hypothetical protein
VTPRQDVMTFNKWFAAGFMLRTDANAIQVKQLGWFHRSQVDVFGPRPKPESLTQEQLAEFRRRIQQIQPVQPTTVAE